MSRSSGPGFEAGARGSEHVMESDDAVDGAGPLQYDRDSAMSRTGQADDVRAALQRAAATEAGGHGADPHRVAAGGLAGGAGKLPHGDAIQASFGNHDVSDVQAHVGGPAADASAALGARAYATGNHVAFAEQPDLHTAAHEAAHVVQQRGGVQLKGGVGEVGDRYEQHADAVADRVVAGGSAQALLDPYAGGGGGAGVQGLQLKKTLGNIEYQFGTKGAKESVAVHTRTVSEWKTFLKNDADEKEGSTELSAFMARACGMTSLDGMPWWTESCDISGIRQPSGAQAVDLMEAFLTVGEGIDLADKGFEGSQFSRYVQGPLMAAFNTGFAPKAIARISKRGEMGSGQFDAVKAYAEDAGDMHDIAQANRTDASGRFSGPRPNKPDPNQRLIASALGTAVGGALKVHEAGSAAANNADKAEGYNLVSNGAKIIAACIEQARKDEATQKAVIMTLFKAAAGVAGAASGGTTAMVLGALTPVAEEFLSSCLGGTGPKAVRKLKDDFNLAIDKSVRESSMNATDAATVKNTFGRGLVY